MKHVGRSFDLQDLLLNYFNLCLVSDTDSGHGTSTTTLTDSPKTNRQDEIIEIIKRKTAVKGLFNIGNTCFFNVIVQV